MQYNLDDCIHTVEKQKEKIVRNNTEQLLMAYTYSGNGVAKGINETSDEAYAKCVTVGDTSFFYVKIAKIGRESGKLPDPSKMEFKNGKASETINGIKVFQWKSVKQELFDEYLKYLITGEEKWLRAAQNNLRS